MRRFGRTWCWRVAAIVSATVAVLGLAVYDIPGLVGGASVSRDPFWVVLGSSASDVAALIAAFGAWTRQVWGVVLLLVVNCFWIVQTVTTLLSPQNDADVLLALVLLVVHCFVMWCCLAPGRAGFAAVGRTDSRTNEATTVCGRLVSVVLSSQRDFVLAVVLLGAQFVAVTGVTMWVWSGLARAVGENGGTGMAALVAVAAAIATLPFSSPWIIEGVHRLLDQRSPIDPSPFAALSSELHEPVDVLTAMAATIRDALDVRAVQITSYPAPGGPSANGQSAGPWSVGATATVGSPTGFSTEVPLTLAGRDHGIVRATTRKTVLRRSRKRELLGDLARQVALVVSSAVLREELEDSRERLVLAREEERRRIRRDIHDGLGPSLAAIKLQLGALRRQMKPHGPDLDRIDEISDALGDATAEIRRVVENLRPRLLDECGLVEALRNLGLVPATIALDIEAPTPMPPIPAAVEVALYRIAVEAVHNTVRHARATRCVVDLQVGPSLATLTVTDDGCATPVDVRSGVGTSAMSERAAELGGTLSIKRTPDGATIVIAALPMRSSRPP